MKKNGKKFIFAILCIQILACTIINTSANIIKKELSYNEYLKSDIIFEPKSIGYGYDDCFFFTNAEGSYYNKEFNMVADDYFYMYNVEKKEKTKVFGKSVVTYYPYKDNIYCVLKDNSIIRITATGKNETLIYKGDNKISDLYADDYVLYFIMNNTVYRYFMSEKILDKLIYHENLCSFMPISNNKIEWSYSTSEWLKYLKETGDTDNQNYMKTANCMSFDAITKQNSYIDNWSIYNDTNENKEIPPVITITPNSLNSNNEIIPFAGTIPLAAYPAGSYFSSISTGCTCHPGCDVGISCDCLRAYGPTGLECIQCQAFGSYVYRTIWNFSGSTSFNNKVTGISLDPKDTAIAANQIQTFIESKLNQISFIRFSKRSNSSDKHTIIIAAIDPTNKRILAYHGNSGGPCKVAYNYITYDKLGTDYIAIDYAYKGGT